MLVATPNASLGGAILRRLPRMAAAFGRVPVTLRRWQARADKRHKTDQMAGRRGEGFGFDADISGIWRKTGAGSRA